MEIITMESEAYQTLVLRIQRIEQFVVDATAEKGKPDDEVWLGTKEACRMMGVSERTMQQLKGNKSVVITKVECKEKTEEPPLLYDLTTLQKNANVNHRISFSSVVYAIHLKWIQWSHLGRDTRGAFYLIKTIRCRTALRRLLCGCVGAVRRGCSCRGGL